MKTVRLLTFAILAGALSAAAQPHPNNERGFQPDKVYQFGGLDHVNIYNGNLMIRLPIVSNKVSSTLSYDLTLTYNTKVWDYLQEYVEGVPYMFAVPNRRSNAGVGWLLSLGTLYGPSNQTQTGTPAWVYEGPDGTDHKFYATLHNVSDGSAGASYTRDSTYLRMRTVSSTIREIDFPDGQIHKFEATGQNNIYRLVQMRDRYDNWVSIDYNPVWTRCTAATTTSAFVITDSGAGARQTDVCLKNESYDGSNRRTVQEVVLSTVGGAAPARYRFSYLQKTIPLGCERTWLYEPSSATVPTLSNLHLPDGTKFDFFYRGGTGWCSDGNLLTMYLPTGGRHEYDYGDYRIPVSSQCGDPWKQGWLAITPGITSKRQYDENGLAADWKYTPLNDTTYIEYECWEGQEYLGQGMMPPEEHITFVTTPDKDETRYYFSVWPGYNETHDPSPANGFVVYEYGLPFSRKYSDPTGSGGFLSSEVFDCDEAGGNCVSKQQTYVAYEFDIVPDQEKYDSNRRQKRQRVVWNSDNNYYTDVNNDSFDGFGHYRTMTVSGTFGNGATKDVTKSTFVDYNPGADQYGRINGVLAFAANGQPWLLNRYTESRLSSGSTVESKTSVCFDGNGFLRGTRRYKNPSGTSPGAGDLVTLYTPDSLGYMQQEDHFGGDLQSTTHITDLCAFAEGSRYRLSHTYTAGEVTSSQYHYSTGSRDAFLSVASQTVDPYTGVVTASTDAAGVTTSFSFDAMRRISGVASAGTATTSYVYKNKGDAGYPNATVLVNTDAAAAANDSQRKIEYDYLGRVKLETRDQADGVAKRQTKYDAMGRKSEISEWGTTPTHFTKMKYDFLSRPTHVYAPDYTTANNHVTTMSYTGGRQTQRTVPIGMSYSGGAVAETPVTVTEKFDIHDRLIEVQEFDVLTYYSYDLSNRLTSVQQNGWDRMGFSTGSTRTFTYDARGLLTSESHPESNTQTYSQFDAKGHAWKKDQGNVRHVFDLEFEFDDAERLTKIFSRNPSNLTGPFRLSKQFVFDYGNNNGKSNGKLIQAIRHNYHADLGDVVVTESMRYDDEAGRLTDKTTLITNATYGGTYGNYTQEFGYNDLGDQTTMKYPTCFSIYCGTPAIATLTRNYTRGTLKAIPGYIDNITYWPNGLYNTITHSGSPQVVDTQIGDDAGVPRPKSISFGNATSCTSPTISDPADQTIAPDTSTTISVTVGGTGPLTTKWYRGPAGDRSWEWGTGTSTNTGQLNSTTTFWAEVTNSCGRAATTAIVISMCSAVAVTAPSSVAVPYDSNTVLTASAAGGSGFTYDWYQGQALLQSGSSSSYTTPNLTADTTYRVRATNSCGAWDEKTIAVTVTCPTPVLSGPNPITIPPNSGTTLTVTATGGATPFTYQWLIGTQIVGTSSASHPTGNLTSTRTYRVVVTNACNQSAETTVTVTVASPPSNLIVTSVNAARLDLTWAASSSVNYYRIERKAGSGGYAFLANAATNSYIDQSVTAGNAYAYRVRAEHNDGTDSSWTNVDIGTTVTYAQAIVDGVTIIDDTHLAELRAAANALRATANLAAYGWTDPTIVPGVTPIKLVHLTQLRAAINEARAALNVPQVGFTDPTLVVDVTPVRGTHWRELREATK